jgi:hypothetical protein
MKISFAFKTSWSSKEATMNETVSLTKQLRKGRRVT